MMNTRRGFAVVDVFLLLMTVLFLLITCFACNDGDHENEAGDDDSNPENEDNDNNDDDQENALYAAAGHIVLSPNEINHPETIYLGGIFPSRLGTGLHDDLMASALALKQGDEEVIIVSLDFLGFSRSRGREIQERLAHYGFEKEHILICSTHTHEAPDTLGVFGPNVLTSGVSPTYMAFVQDSVVELVLQTWAKLTPVTMRAAKVPVNDPLSNYPTLIADFRDPLITVDWLSAAVFEDENEEVVASLVNWHAHPEVMIESTLISSDFPQWTRQRMEDVIGGNCVYVSGALGGLSSPTGVSVPARDESGDPIFDENQQPVYLTEGTWEKTRSLGFVIADLAIDGLNQAQAVTAPTLEIKVQEMLLPVSNPIMILAFVTGLVEYEYADLVRSEPGFCGFFGCSSDRLAVVKIGPVTLLSSPGETFPETLIGREESVVDFGGEWGEFTFPAMESLALHMGEIPMHLAECGNEIGYLIPESDFHPKDHPDYYEEDLFWGYETETVYRDAAKALLLEMTR